MHQIRRAGTTLINTLILCGTATATMMAFICFFTLAKSGLATLAGAPPDALIQSALYLVLLCGVVIAGRQAIRHLDRVTQARDAADFDMTG